MIDLNFIGLLRIGEICAEWEQFSNDGELAEAGFEGAVVVLFASSEERGEFGGIDVAAETTDDGVGVGVAGFFGVGGVELSGGHIEGASLDGGAARLAPVGGGEFADDAQLDEVSGLHARDEGVEVVLESFGVFATEEGCRDGVAAVFE